MPSAYSIKKSLKKLTSIPDKPLFTNTSSISFKNMENKNGVKRLHCLTPKEHSQASLNLFPSLTLDLTAHYMDLILFKMFPLIPNFINFIQRLSLTT